MAHHSSDHATPAEPSLDQTLRALSDSRRRAVLSHLFDREANGPATVEELARRIAADDAERTRWSLRHAHLPRLDDAGIVSYERRARRVRLAGDQSAVESLLAAARNLY